MKTIIDIPIFSRLHKTHVGSFLRRIGLTLKTNKKFNKSFNKRLLNIDKGLLSKEEIEEIYKYESTKTKNIEYLKRKSMLLPSSIEEINRYSQRTVQVIPIADEIIKKDAVKVVANIGARVDFVSCFFAKRYPKKTFLSVDMSNNLSEENCFLERANNWEFISGIAYELFKEKKLKCDATIFCSTLALFRRKELIEYIKIMHKSDVKYIIINEPFSVPIKPLRPFKVISPLDIPVDKTYIGGSYIEGICVYLHNYIKIFEENGYEIVYSKMSDSTWISKQYLIQIIARRC